MPNETPRRPFVLHTRVVTGVGGGPEKTILNSPRFLADAGYDSACAFMHPSNDPGWASLVERAELADAEILSVPDGGPFDPRVLYRLVRICRQRGVTIWHGHDYKSNALGLAVAKLHPMKLVTTVHGWVTNTHRSKVYYHVDRWSMRWYDRVLCVSPDLVDRCLAAGVSEERVQLVENGILADDYERTLSREAAKAKFHVPSNRILIGALGRLSPEKGFNLLIKAVNELIREGRDVGLLIGGEGGEHAKLATQIQSAGLEDRIHLMGHLSDPRQFFQALDIFALSSLREGLPNVVLEAMACELPIVATRIAGVPRAIDDQKNGLLIEPGRWDNLRDALRTMVLFPDRRTEFGIAARKTVVERFGFARRMASLVDVYRDVLPTPETKPTPEPLTVGSTL
ncbi:glycosyltransferase family 4 protein [Thalassoroseus pseudoceratinae]|uniref:glycosyltransferase family 4 protein n=1 Tax=Thalassoroseus pseudoceratinae TaxID=2713176 RepID=UPI0014212119|nr:glycosyltransferase family 4 protein [Thalassoroseus pseudoceratinae]